MSSDLPDYTRLIVVNVDVDPLEQAPMIPRPLGVLLASGHVTTSGTYQTVATHTVTDGKSLQLAKIMVSAQKAAKIKLRWDGSQIGEIRHMDDITLLLEHFPWGYYEMEGDGTKAFDVQAVWDTEAGTVGVEICGEEVDT